MKKKTRGIRKHYRFVEMQMRYFDIDLSDDSWYSFWHTHLDWDGLTNNSQKHRKKHIQYYISLLDKIEELTKESDRDFQTWIFLDWAEGYYDAIFFHTENPNNDFPFKDENIKYSTEMPVIISQLFDLSKYTIGKIENENGCRYFIQKIGLGKGIKESTDKN